MSIKFTILCGAIMGLIGGILATLFLTNFFETHFWTNSAFTFLPVISLIVFMIIFSIFLGRVSGKEKLIKFSIFIPIYLALHYAALITIMMWTFSEVGRRGGII